MNKSLLITPFNYSTRTEDVFQVLRQAILNNELKSGDRLLEFELSKRLNVSRTPVRESIRMLEAKGLVTRRSNGHAVVADRSLETMIETFHARIAMESYVARLAAESITDAQLEQLSNLCAQTQRMYETEDTDGLRELGNTFHNTLLEIAGNRQIAKHIREILEFIDIYRERLYRSTLAIQSNIVSHEEIVGALRARDSDAAAELMRKHLLSALDNLRDLWAVET